MQKPFTFSVFQKLWPSVSAHVGAFPTFPPISKSTYPSRFYYKYSLPASKLGFISNFSHFQSLHVVEFNSSVSKKVGFAFETRARLHRVSSGKRKKLDSMATFWAKIPYRNIVSEMDFFKNQITHYPSLVSRRKPSFEGLYFEEITPFRSLEDEYGATLFGADLRENSITPNPIFQRSTWDDSFRISLQSSIFSLILHLASLLG